MSMTFSPPYMRSGLYGRERRIAIEAPNRATIKAIFEQRKVMFEAMSVNGYPYKKENGQWVPDEEARSLQLIREADEQKHKDALVLACRSRVLTTEEMAEMEREGTHLFIRYNGGMSQAYKQEELEHALNELLLQQFRLRRIAQVPQPPEIPNEYRVPLPNDRPSGKFKGGMN